MPSDPSQSHHNESLESSGVNSTYIRHMSGHKPQQLEPQWTRTLGNVTNIAECRRIEHQNADIPIETVGVTSISAPLPLGAGGGLGIG